MKRIIKTLILSSFITTAYAGPKAQWQVAIDKSNTNLLTHQIDSMRANTNKETVSYSYILDQTEELNFDIKPFSEKSKQYWIDSTGNKLVSGISLPVSGGDTVIRISPLTNDKSIQIESHMIKIQNNGTTKSINVFADSSQLKACFMTASKACGEYSLKTKPFPFKVLRLKGFTVSPKPPVALTTGTVPYLKLHN